MRVRTAAGRGYPGPGPRVGRGRGQGWGGAPRRSKSSRAHACTGSLYCTSLPKLENEESRLAGWPAGMQADSGPCGAASPGWTSRRHSPPSEAPGAVASRGCHRTPPFTRHRRALRAARRVHPTLPDPAANGARARAHTHTHTHTPRALVRRATNPT